MFSDFEKQLQIYEPKPRNRRERRALERRRKKIAKKAAMEVKKHYRTWETRERTKWEDSYR